MSGGVWSRLSDSPNENHRFAALLVEELVRNGVDFFCVCPGSRSTPLAWAVASHPEARSVVHFDERGAAFHALGIAKATGRPAAFVCTSGTAVANAYPAVIEASFAQVPLIVLTADRPARLQDTGANQTIDQVKIFGDHVRWHAPAFGPARLEDPRAVLTTVDQAVSRSMGSPRGPVHLNCVFDEPLAPVSTRTEAAWDTTGANIRGWADDGEPYTRYEAGLARLSEEALARLVAELNSVGRGLLVIGQLSSKADVEAARALARALGWPAFPDVASGLRLGGDKGPFVRFYDRLLGAGEFGDVLRRVELVLHVGGAITSKALSAFLESGVTDDGMRLQYFRVAEHAPRYDPGHVVSQRIVAQLPALVEDLLPALLGTPDSEWLSAFISASEAVDSCVQDSVRGGDPPNEISVARLLTGTAPSDGVLFVGNSMPIRDADMFGSAEGDGGVVAANRGASGIDGNIATATGHARGLGRPVTAIIGDLAALHDVNSLALLKDLPAPVVLVVINNNGGGIFHFLPIAEHAEHFEEYFGTPHGIGFEAVARGFGLAYHNPSTNAELLEVYERAVAGPVSCMIEVQTKRDENRKLHDGLNEIIAERLKNL